MTSSEFVERMGAALTDAGLPALASRVFSALLGDDDGRMTSAELVDALTVSPAGVSGAVRYLAGVGLLRRTREPGSRRDVYVVEDDAWHEAMMRHDQRYAPLRRALEAGIAELPASGAAAGARRRLELTLDFLEFLEGELDAIAVRWQQRLDARGR